MRRGFSLLLIVGALAAVGLTGSFVAVRIAASVPQDTAQGTSTSGEGATSSDGYIVELSEPPLLQRTEVMKSLRAVHVLKDLARAKITAASSNSTDTKLLQQRLKKSSAALASAAARARASLERQQDSVMGAVEQILQQRHGTGSMNVGGVFTRDERGHERFSRFSIASNGFSLPVVDLSPEERSAIETLDGVRRVIPNAVISLPQRTKMSSVETPDLRVKENTPRLPCATGDSNCFTGRGIAIAIIDTGIDYTHPDFGPCKSMGTGCKVKGGWDFGDRDPDPMDPWGNGTFVASIAAGNGTLKGMAPDADLFAYRVFDGAGKATEAMIRGALERSMDPNSDGNLEDHVQVINMSYGYPEKNDPDDPLCITVDNIVNAGVVVSVAAGDYDGWPPPNTPFSVSVPAAARKAIAVGAVDHDGVLPIFSAWGPSPRFTVKPDIAAVGVNVCGAKIPGVSGYVCRDGEHMYWSSTNAAAPSIAGLSALLMESHPGITPEQVKQTLRDTTFKYQIPYFSPYMLHTVGFGFVYYLEKILSEEPYNPVRLDTSGPLNDIVDIRGSVSMPDFQFYSLSLYYRPLDNDVVIQKIVTNRRVAPTDGILARGWDTRLLQPEHQWPPSMNTLVLEVTDTAGRVHRDATYVFRDPAAPPTSSSSSAGIDQCGNATCESQETPLSCIGDCWGRCNVNGICDPQEGYLHCGDCKNPCNGNGVCERERGEIWERCNDCVDTCGNGLCEPQWKDSTSCPQDCTSYQGSSSSHTSSPAMECGNGRCEAGETWGTCPADCSGTCFRDYICEVWEEYASCDDCMNPCNRNNICEPERGENHWTCYDCGLMCGNGKCECSTNEEVSCPFDCVVPIGSSSSSSQYTQCGNLICEPPEKVATCPADCSGGCNRNMTCEPREEYTTCTDCMNPCDSNGFCNENENALNCPSDCPSTCGNGVCECSRGEDYTHCWRDCGGSNIPGCNRNGSCEEGEYRVACPMDCLASCGNGVCEVGEHIKNCARDCTRTSSSSSSSSSESSEEASSSSESSEESSSSSESSDESSSSSESSQESSSESSDDSSSSSSESSETSSSSSESSEQSDSSSSSSSAISSSSSHPASSSSVASSSSSSSSLPKSSSSASSARSSSSAYSSSPVSCGDGSCDPGFGENHGTCPDDCSGTCNFNGRCDSWEEYGTCRECSAPRSSSSSSSSLSSHSSSSLFSSSSQPSSSSASSASSSSSSATAAVCTDTDPSQHPGVRGTVITYWGAAGGTREFPDRCGTGLKSNELTQFWCLPGGVQGTAGRTILCPSGCADGACDYR